MPPVSSTMQAENGVPEPLLPPLAAAPELDGLLPHAVRARATDAALVSTTPARFIRTDLILSVWSARTLRPPAACAMVTADVRIRGVAVPLRLEVVIWNPSGPAARRTEGFRGGAERGQRGGGRRPGHRRGLGGQA